MVKEDTFFERMREPSPIPTGTRIRLVAMPEDPNPVPVGTEGTVLDGNGAQVWVRWEPDGRQLALLPGLDRWEVIG